MNKKQLVKQLYKGNKFNFAFLILFALLDTAVTIAVSIMLERVISIAYEKDLNALKEQGILFLILMIIFVLGYLVNIYVKPKYKKKAMSQYKQNIYNAILNKNISSFTKYETSNYISSLTNDVNYIEENYIFSIFELVKYITVFIASIVIMILYSPILTILSIVLAFLPLVCALFVGNKLSDCEKQISDDNASFMHYIKDNLLGFSTIKVFKSEDKMKQLFSKNNNKLEISKAKKVKVNVLIELIQGVTNAIAQLGIFFIGAYISIKNDTITPATIILFVQLMNSVLGPLMMIPPIISKRNACNPLFDKICEMVKYEEEANTESISFDNNINIEELKYSIDNKTIIDGINFSFDKNKSYAIVGPSGSGKTTLLNLLIGKYNNYDGSIMYDNKEITNISQDSLYQIITFIEQSVFVFDDTIVNNITMYNNVDEKVLQNVIKQSGLETLINEKGLDYKCGENGSNLSGGEKQRIAIARGLLKNSQIMFLDEITSALDNETSNTIINNVLQLNNITKIMITHKLEEKVLKNFDTILVIKNGKIHEQGTYDELINNNNLFKTLVELN